MKIAHIDQFTKGWFVGKFEPSLLKDDFEVGFHQHKAGEFHKDHFHKLGTEINVMIEGYLLVNDKKFGPGEIFVLEPYEISQVTYITDVKLIVVRNRSDPTDKYEIEIK